MKEIQDYLPKKERSFLSWALNFIAELDTMRERLDFPTTVFEELTALCHDFDEKLAIADAPATRTKAAVQAKNGSRKAFDKRLWKIVAEYLTHNHLLSDPDRDNLGLPIHKTSRTHAPVATNSPDCDVDTSIAGQVTFYYYPKGGKQSSAKPDGQHGAELAWAILHAPTTEWNDLLHSAAGRIRN